MNKSTFIGALRGAFSINARRGALGVAACGALSLSLLMNAPEAQAQTAAKQIKSDATPQQHTQVPGYFRYLVGDVEVTALYDGYIQLDPKLLKGIQSDDLQKLLAKLFIDSTDGVQTAVNAYLINTGDEVVLVDTGAAKCFGPTLGGMLDNLRASGYQPEQVNLVVLTHLHADHACGLVAANGEAAFPNATVRAAKEEADFWLDEERAAKAPEAQQGFFTMSRNSVAPYKSAKRFSTFGPNEKLAKTLSVVPSPGHTPGHSSLLIESAGKSLLILGDVVHNYAVQFPRPEVAIEFDTDSEQAIKTRKQIFADAAANRLAVAGAHLPFPGIGHVGTQDQGYLWVPASYSPVSTQH